MKKDLPRNVLGGALLSCSMNPRTGFFRNGCCETGPEDTGRRWQEALLAGEAPPVFLQGTHESVLNFVSLEELLAHAVDAVAEA